MNTLKYTIMLATAITLTACASNKVIIDPAGVDMQQYEQDLATCKQIAEQVDSQTGKRAVSGALISGTVGAILGDSGDAKRWASVGAVTGGARGAGETRKEKDQVVKNCLRGRGYKVLN